MDWHRNRNSSLHDACSTRNVENRQEGSIFLHQANECAVTICSCKEIPRGLIV